VPLQAVCLQAHVRVVRDDVNVPCSCCIGAYDAWTIVEQIE